MKIKKGKNDSLSHKHKGEIQILFHKFKDLLMSRNLNNNSKAQIQFIF